MNKLTTISRQSFNQQPSASAESHNVAPDK